MLRHVLLVLCAAFLLATAQEDVDAAVDSFLGDEFGDSTTMTTTTTSVAPTTTVAPETTAPLTTVAPTTKAAVTKRPVVDTKAMHEWLMAQQRELLKLHATAMLLNNATSGTGAQYQFARYNTITAMKRFRVVSAAVRNSNATQATKMRRAPAAVFNLTLGVVGMSGEAYAFMNARMALFGVLTVVFVASLVLMVLHRRVVERFWVALLVPSLVASVVNIVFAAIERMPRDFDSPLALAIAVFDFLYTALLTGVLMLYTIVLCRALYAVAFPDKGPLTVVATIVPLCVLAAAIVYGIFALVYALTSGQFLLNVTPLLFYLLASTVALVLVAACVLSVIKRPSLPSALLLGASLLLFGAWCASTVLEALIMLVSRSIYGMPFAATAVATQVLTLAEVAVYLLLQLVNVMRSKSTPKSADDSWQEEPGYSELEEENVPRRYSSNNY